MTEDLYRLIYEQLSLKTVGILLGLALIGGHAYAYFQGEKLKKWLVKVPRNRNLGIAILIVCTAWSWILITYMDLGEFYTLRKGIQVLLPVLCFLVVYFVDEFLAVRALGVLLMLMAGPILTSAFLKEPFTRLLIPILAYVWILVGMFWVGMPYLMRDWIDWVVAKSVRWERACYIGAGYGALMLLCALIAY